ncbi:MAG: hypothetical protein GY928_18555, partial [Colwellia sp.]|nr:hypothetical protein [Colwellia sp.]
MASDEQKGKDEANHSLLTEQRIRLSAEEQQSNTMISDTSQAIMVSDNPNNPYSRKRSTTASVQKSARNQRAERRRLKSITSTSTMDDSENEQYSETDDDNQSNLSSPSRTVIQQTVSSPTKIGTYGSFDTSIPTQSPRTVQTPLVPILKSSKRTKKVSDKAESKSETMITDDSMDLDDPNPTNPNDTDPNPIDPNASNKNIKKKLRFAEIDRNVRTEVRNADPYPVLRLIQNNSDYIWLETKDFINAIIPKQWIYLAEKDILPYQDDADIAYTDDLVKDFQVNPEYRQNLLEWARIAGHH